MNINKKQVADVLLREIDAECLIIQSAVDSAVQAATDSESKPENKYDTRALEASYLAGAQAARLEELKGMRAHMNSLDWNASPSSVVKSLSMVGLESDNKITYWMLLPFGGGYKLQVGSAAIQTISSNSPLGQAMLGKGVGDFIEIQVGQAFKEYLVTSVQ